jgi:hypothetical protein
MKTKRQSLTHVRNCDRRETVKSKRTMLSLLVIGTLLVWVLGAGMLQAAPPFEELSFQVDREGNACADYGLCFELYEWRDAGGNVILDMGYGEVYKRAYGTRYSLSGVAWGQERDVIHGVPFSGTETVNTKLTLEMDAQLWDNDTDEMIGEGTITLKSKLKISPTTLDGAPILCWEGTATIVDATGDLEGLHGVLDQSGCRPPGDATLFTGPVHFAP